MITRSVDRILRMFEVFADRLKPLTLSELARALDMPVSSCANLIKTLQSRGYLYEVGGRKMYYPTSRWLQKAAAITNANPVEGFVKPFLEQLRDEVGETIFLAKQMGDQAIVLCICESRQEIRYNGEVGALLPLRSTASGKAMVGAMPLVKRLELISRISEADEGPAMRARRDQLLAEFDDGKLGWWTARSQRSPEVMGLSAPVIIRHEIYTITVAGLASRMQPRIEGMGKRLLAMCRKVNRAA